MLGWSPGGDVAFQNSGTMLYKWKCKHILGTAGQDCGRMAHVACVQLSKTKGISYSFPRTNSDYIRPIGTSEAFLTLRCFTQKSQRWNQLL
jgi:hypothetical protein